jgi:stringent starvation protein B
MLSNKPYLIRAFNEWIVDSRCTPLLVVDATQPRCNVPREYIENGEIILNISPDAIRDLKISSNVVEFKASFSGIAHLISVPVKAVLAIYAEENGQGMFFDSEHEEEGEEGGTDWDVDAAVIKQDVALSEHDKKKSHLKLVE